MSKIEIGTTVLHPDHWARKEFPTGTVIELGAGHQEGRARVKWNGADRIGYDGSVVAPRNLRTWTAIKRLSVVS
jgi:hypothetical protein